MSNETPLSFKQIIDVLSASINPENRVMDLVPDYMQELLYSSLVTSLSIVTASEMVINSGGQIDYQQMYDLLRPLLTDKKVIESYNSWKNDLYGMTPEMLKRKRVQVIFEVLRQGIMRHDTTPCNMEIDNIPKEKIKPWLSCGEDIDDNTKKDMARLMRYLIIDGDIVMINRTKFGKYAMSHAKDFSHKDTKAMFKLDAILDLVNADLVAQNPRLQAIINKYRLQPEPLNTFAPAKNIKRILTQSEVLALVSNRQKYTAEWIEQFVDDLLASEKGKSIIVDWGNSKKRNKLPALVAGSLVKAGVFGCSYPVLARAIRMQHDFKVKTECYATYMGKQREQPYLDWVLAYVKC
ncbi:hypothetical protein [Prevotella sp. P6B4]|uniref:hypothetical protein n=1 Tax=Prevotella sp. P6B4 TaxID=1410614 RepID=UPI0012DD0FFB|nr:hypothetical protein [Prevotella sp. P6B4]